jgi:membrane carboxypeptidase/penicillin-binding protein PbpC
LVGRGLNPQTWVQVGTDSRSLVVGDTLVTWDTSDLNGLYALQLQTVRNDQRIETSVIQVTVDNTPPDVSITYPQDGDVLDYEKNRQMTFQVAATDNLSLSVVEFYVDGEWIGTIETAPFSFTWSAVRGEHELRVVARDRAGNESELEIGFVLE